MRPFGAGRALTAMTLPLTLPLSLRGTSEHLQMPEPLPVCVIPFRAHYAYGVDPVTKAAAVPRRLERDTRTNQERLRLCGYSFVSDRAAGCFNVSQCIPRCTDSPSLHDPAPPGEVAASFGLDELVSHA